MRYFLSALSVILLLSACTTRSAFDKFGVSKEQEKAIENTRSGKIRSKHYIHGIYSVIYLKNQSTRVHQFYVAVYLKDDTEDAINFTLDEKAPLKVVKLASTNRYSHLLAMKNEWTSNYLVTFKNEKATKINLVIDNGLFSSDLLNYKVD